MNTFCEHHQHNIAFHYRCFDRILLNAAIQPFQQPARVMGFFWSYRQLYPVSRQVLRDIAAQYHNCGASSGVVSTSTAAFHRFLACRTAGLNPFARAGGRSIWAAR
jgi:hypothetical protein